MKKIITISMAAMALVACNKGNLVENGATLIAHTDEACAKSHLSIESGVNKVYWDANDAINVFAKASGAYQSNKFTTSESGTTAKFNGGDVALNENCYALFPYNEAASFSEGTGFTTSISSVEQKMSDKTFSSSINLAVGKCSASKEVSFKNAGALLSFTLTQDRADTIKYIEIKANKGETLAVNGAVSVNWNGGAPVISPAADAEKSSVITIKPTGETFNTGETYYVWVLPGTYADGITFTLVSPTNMKAAKAGATALTAGRNQIVALGEIGGLKYKGSDAEKKTLVFDFNSCPDGWPNGITDYKTLDHTEQTHPYVLDGVTYNFTTATCLGMKETSTRSIAWGYDGTNTTTYFVMQAHRFLGLPAIEGWKLITIKFAQSLKTSSGRKVTITTAVTAQGEQANAAVSGGEPMAVGTNGEEYTFNLASTAANTRYYFAPSASGSGFASLTLVYEKVD